jgi:hypothetical protein
LGLVIIYVIFVIPEIIIAFFAFVIGADWQPNILRTHEGFYDTQPITPNAFEHNNQNNNLTAVLLVYGIYVKMHHVWVIFGNEIKQYF